MPRPFFRILAPLGIALALVASGPATLRAQVKVSLVAADSSVRPGEPILLALHLVHQPGWHTYWQNPGTGLPTSLAWELPKGWSGGPILWPAPRLIRDSRGNTVGNGYTGDVLLPVEVTPPATLKPGEKRVDLRVKASWLMCQDVCIPGDKVLTLSLPVTQQAPSADLAWSARIRAVVDGLPATDPHWAADASRTGTVVRLHVRPVPGPGARSGRPPWALRFFSDDGLIAFDEPQVVKPDGAGGFLLDLPVADDGPANPTHLTGVLTSQTGWRRGGALEGLLVDAPLAGPAGNGSAGGDAGTASAGGGAAVGGASPDGSGSGAPGAGPAASALSSVPQPPSPGPASAAPAGLNSAAPAAPGSPAPLASAPAATPSPTHPRTPAPPPPHTSFLEYLGLAFLGGLILNLMPCVFPVLGIKILGFVNQAGHNRTKVAAHGGAFAGGIYISFWSLAAVLTVLRASGEQLGWGFQLQYPGFNFGLTLVLLVFGLNLSGVFEFGLSATGIGSSLQTRGGYSGSFFTGVLATVSATPCSAPFLAPALGAALTLSPIESFALFTAIATGLAAPALALSAFPGAVRILPRPGAWMETLRQAMAFPLYATAGYLLWVLAGQVRENSLLEIILGLVVIAMGAWAFGRWAAPGASPGRVRFGLLAGALLFTAGVWTGWPRPPAPSDIAWEAWSPGAVARLRADNRIVYVDFTARWCATCQTNKRMVFHSPDVLQFFHDRNIATLRGDWTSRDPRITAELAHYHRGAVPFNLVWLPGRDRPVILPELLTPTIVLRAVRGDI